MSTTPTDHRTTTVHRPRRPARPPRPARRPHGERGRPPRVEAAARVGRLAGEQLAVAAGQLGAGLGNLVFALIAARVLAPGAFAELAAFLALYLLIHVPAGSLSAGSALSPALAARARRRALAAGAVAGGALAVLAVPLGALLDLSPLLLLAAAATAPTAGLLALDRGRLYGLGRRRRVVGSLLAEPAVRLTLGVALATLAGPVGGAIAVVVAGWAALAVAYLPPATTRGEAAGRSRRAAAADARGAAAGDARRGAVNDSRGAATGHSRGAAAGEDAVRPAGAVVAFLLLAVVQNQDVLLANALLGGEEAGRFAVISTLGGIAAFATTTVPLMLLPRAGEGRDALRAALAVAALLGAGAVAVVALSPERLVGLVFGGRYASAGAVAVPYVLAMAMLGVARVLVAHACAGHAARRAVALLVPVALLHAALVVVLGDDAAGIATATLIATTALTAGAAALPRLTTGTAALPRLTTGTAALPRLTTGAARRLATGTATRRRALAAAAAFARRRDVAIVAVFAAAGLVLRLIATRGIWLDEATSIDQAQMPLGEMLDVLRANDVHPPLHHLVLWVTVRLLGTGELAVRMPSLIAATALVPLLYVVAREVYDRRAGYAAAALGAVAPFAVWYAQEARMYALFMVFALLALWLQVRIVREGGRTRDVAGYVLAAAALVYTQYFGVLFVGVQALAFALAVARGALPARRALVGAAVLAALIAPLAPFALDQFAANESSGRGFQQPAQAGGAVEPGAAPGAYAALTNAAWAVLGYHSDATMTAIAALWPLGLLLALALLGRGRSWPTLLVVACALLPGVALFALGQAKPFVFEVRYFVGAVPLALLLIARGLTSWARRPAVVAAACAAAVATLALGLADQQLNGSNPRVYDFKQAVHAIEARARPGDLVVFSPKYVDTVVGYYGREGLRIRPLEDGLPRPRRGQRVFLLASFLDKPQYREATQDAVRRLSRRYELVRRDRVPQIRTWEFRHDRD